MTRLTPPAAVSILLASSLAVTGCTASTPTITVATVAQFSAFTAKYPLNTFSYEYGADPSTRTIPLTVHADTNRNGRYDKADGPALVHVIIDTVIATDLTSLLANRDESATGTAPNAAHQSDLALTSSFVREAVGAGLSLQMSGTTLQGFSGTSLTTSIDVSGVSSTELGAILASAGAHLTGSSTR